MFVSDVSDTEPIENARPLPPEVEMPFDVRKGWGEHRLRLLIENAKRDGDRVANFEGGSQSAGRIQVLKDANAKQEFVNGLDRDRQPVILMIPVGYDIVINTKLSPEDRYATMAHEFAHLYCGHFGTPDDSWWPNRRGMAEYVEEFEAESVAYLVSARAGLDNPSERYLAGYLGACAQAPEISLECVMKAAGLIEQMSKKRIRARPERSQRRGT